jgi:sigma-B regulation protein RsbU (phosphoserine phosphatase)
MPKNYDTHLQEFDVIAETWLGIGASSFSYWEDGQLIRKWGEFLNEGDHLISALIRVHGQVLGELRVEGIVLPNAQKRLQTDAQLISKLLPLEKERRALAEELIDIRDQLVTLWSLSEQSDLTIDLDALLKRFASEAVRLVRAQAAFFLISKSDEEYITVIQPDQFSADSAMRDLFKLAQSNHGPVVYEGRFLNAASESEHNYLIIPFQIENKRTALLGVMRDRGEFLYKDIRLANVIASHTATQIEALRAVKLNIELARLETEMEMAQKIQRSNMPRSLPQIPGLEIDVTAIPASQVGGDLYDIIYEPNQAANFAIGDISGKGMPAALLHALMMKFVHTQISMPGNVLPDQVIMHLNRELYTDFNDANMFCTLFVGQYILEDRKLIYANAGQYPILYCPSRGAARMLQADAMPIGVMEEMTCPSNCMFLDVGDVVVLATDGICETSDHSNRLFGFNRLTKLVAELRALSAHEIGARILAELDDFSKGKPQEDDRTMIVIKAM